MQPKNAHTKKSSEKYLKKKTVSNQAVFGLSEDEN